jgi:hypothetical protein
MPRLAELLVFTFLATPLLGQATEGSIRDQLKGLRAVPDAQRPAATVNIANEIKSLPAGLPKLKLADALTHLSTEGDPGHDTLQAVATTLGQALAENPLPVDKEGQPAMPYMDLAKLVRYEHVTTDLTDPMLA